MAVAHPAMTRRVSEACCAPAVARAIAEVGAMATFGPRATADADANPAAAVVCAAVVIVAWYANPDAVAVAG